MSSIPHTTPKTNIPNTVIIYTNGFSGSPISVANSARVFSAMTTNADLETIANIGRIVQSVPYDCIIRNAKAFVVTNDSNQGILMRLAVNEVVPPANTGTANLLEIPIAAGTDGQGLKTSEETFTRVFKGSSIAWELDGSPTGTASVVSYVSIEMIGS